MTGRIMSVGLAALFLGASVASAQDRAVEAMAAAHAWRAEHERQIIADFIELLSMPNVGSNPADIRRNGEHIIAALEARGVDAQFLETDGANPIVFGHLPVAEATRTVTFYVHYDGQPVEPDNWASPPFDPVIRDGRLADGAKPVDWRAASPPLDPDWRIYARSASDDKAPVAAILAALDAMQAAGIVPSVNLKFFFEGEEEMGSPNLARHLARHGEKLASDFWVFLDGPKLQDGRQPMYLGVRGVTSFQLTVYGADRVLHSGHYGNYAPNPIHRLVLLLASMRAPDGEVLIDGFYDNVAPPTERELALIAEQPDPGPDIRAGLGFSEPERPDRRIERAILWPALNFLGIRAGAVGEATRNAIPASATAAIGIRMVPEQDHSRLFDLVAAHVRAQGYHLIGGDEPTRAERAGHPKLAKLIYSDSAYGAVRTAADLPASRAMSRLMETLTGGEAVTVVSIGGSLPLAPIVNELGVPLYIVPIANHDNNQHAPNENLRLGNLWDGIALYAGLFAGIDPALEAVKGD